MKALRFLIIYLFSLILLSCNQETEEKKNISNNTSLQKWETYQSPDLSFQYPPTWILSIDTSKGEIFHITKPEQKEIGIVGYDISISYYIHENDFSEFVEDQVESLKEKYSLEVQEEKEISFDSKRAYKYTIISSTDAGKNEAAEIYFIRGNEKFYQIFNAGMPKHKAQADSIIQTIHLN